MKYEINQEVYFLHEGIVCSSIILTRITIENHSDTLTDLCLVSDSQTLFKSKNTLNCAQSGNYYITRYSMHQENEAFGSKQELLDSL